MESPSKYAIHEADLREILERTEPGRSGQPLGWWTATNEARPMFQVIDEVWDTGPDPDPSDSWVYLNRAARWPGRELVEEDEESLTLLPKAW